MIVIGCDHGGYKLKEEVKKYLEEKQIQYEDVGTYSEERADYPLMAKEVCKKISEMRVSLFVLTSIINSLKIFSVKTTLSLFGVPSIV